MCVLKASPACCHSALAQPGILGILSLGVGVGGQLLTPMVDQSVKKGIK